MSTVAIGIRQRGEMGFNAFWESLIGLDKYGNRLIPSKGYGAVENARQIFRRFLRDGNESHLLMLDDDATFSQHTLTKLLDRNLPVVGALTWTRAFPPAPTIYRGYSQTFDGKHPGWWVRHDDVVKWMNDPAVQKELVTKQELAAFTLDIDTPTMVSRTDAIGFHCVLIRRDVLEAIGEPFCEGDANGVREDFDFSERAIKAGFDLFVDKRVVVGHIAVHPMRVLDYFVFAKVAQEQMNEAAGQPQEH